MTLQELLDKPCDRNRTPIAEFPCGNAILNKIMQDPALRMSALDIFSDQGFVFITSSTEADARRNLFEYFLAHGAENAIKPPRTIN